MALITAIVLFLVGTLGTAISRLLTNESRAWTPRIIQLVIRRAIVRLHPAQRERFEEEWQGHVDEVPGEIGKLTVALGFLTAARRMTLAEKAEDAPLHRKPSTSPIIKKERTINSHPSAIAKMMVETPTVTRVLITYPWLIAISWPFVLIWLRQ